LRTINNSPFYTKNFTVTDGVSTLIDYAISNGIGTLVRASSFLKKGKKRQNKENVRVSWLGMGFLPTTNTNPIYKFDFNLGTD